MLYPQPENLWQHGLAFLRYSRRFHPSRYATHAGYFIVLSVFPLLLLLLSLLRYTGLDVRTLTDLLDGFLPHAFLQPAKQWILSLYQNTSGTVLGVSALVALWSAGRGVYGLIAGLNAIYGVKENRGYLYTRLVSVAYTFLFLLVLLLTLVGSLFGSSLLTWLEESDSGFVRLLSRLLSVRFLLLFFLQSGIFTAMFMVLPNCKNRFRSSWPGAVLASCGWLVFSGLYSVYLEHFSGLSQVFGSVYGLALSMLWLYFLLSILFYGGIFNRYLAK